MGGSVPPLKDQVDYDIYMRMVSLARANKANFIADIPAEYLKTVLKEGPILVKPNSEDLEKIFDIKINSTKDINKYGKKIIEMGAENAIVSYGEEGSMFFSKDGKSYIAEEIDLDKVSNTIACRDAMIGGFIGTLVKTSDTLKAFRLAVAAATATAKVVDLPSRDEIEEFIDKVTIREFS